MTERIIHYSDWSSQPDVHLACDRWTIPAWGEPSDLPDKVYEEDKGDLYTFERAELVSCNECRIYILTESLKTRL